MPGKNRATPDEAMLFLGNVRDRLSLVALSEEEYFETVEASAAAGVTGCGIYDAVLAHCALKAGARTIYTWNVEHFRRLGPEIAKRVTTP
jgi:predicted nucleic acid-binding protein